MAKSTSNHTDLWLIWWYITPKLIVVGISNVSGSCCEVSLNGLSCRENGRVCNNRNEYAYFDGQHNTEALSALVASKIYTSQDISEVYPLNLRQFLQAHALN